MKESEEQRRALSVRYCGPYGESGYTKGYVLLCPDAGSRNIGSKGGIDETLHVSHTASKIPSVVKGRADIISHFLDVRVVDAVSLGKWATEGNGRWPSIGCRWLSIWMRCHLRCHRYGTNKPLSTSRSGRAGYLIPDQLNVGGSVTLVFQVF